MSSETIIGTNVILHGQALASGYETVLEYNAADVQRSQRLWSASYPRQ